MKTMLASSMVDQFPCLRDCHGTGYDAWVIPGRRHKPATGFLEERLRNVLRKLCCGRQVNSASQMPQETPAILPETTITAERAIQLTECLKNIWPTHAGAHHPQSTVHSIKWDDTNPADNYGVSACIGHSGIFQYCI